MLKRKESAMVNHLWIIVIILVSAPLAVGRGLDAKASCKDKWWSCRGCLRSEDFIPRTPLNIWNHCFSHLSHIGVLIFSCSPFPLLSLLLYLWTGNRVQWNKLGKINWGEFVLRNCGIGSSSAYLLLLTLWFWEVTTDHKSKNHPLLLVSKTWHHFSITKQILGSFWKVKPIKNGWLCNLLIFKLRLQEKTHPQKVLLLIWVWPFSCTLILLTLRVCCVLWI